MKRDGFILPSVILIGLGIMIIGLSLVQTSGSILSAVNTVYYRRIASEAAEAGSNYATYCLKSNSYNQTWGTAAGRPALTQSTDCTGAPLAHSITSLTNNPLVKSTFSVGDVTRGSDGTYVINAKGQSGLQSTLNGAVLRQFSANSLKAVGGDNIRFGAVTYGYYPTGRGIASDGSFYAVLGSDGKFHVSGANHVGQLGNGTTTNSLSPQTYETPDSSQAVAAYSNFVSQGYNLFILTKTGEVYGAGLGNSGQLGNGKTDKVNANPQQFILPSGEQATSVAPKGDATYVLTKSHKLYAAGSCNSGQLGFVGGNGCSSLSNPVRVALPEPKTSDPNTIPTSDIVVDASTVFVRMEGGRVYGWGRNNWGQFGNGTTDSSEVPVQVGTLGNSGQPKATQLGFDGDTIYMVASDGNAYAAGRNDYGEIGYPNTTRNFTTVQRVPIPASAGNVVQVATDQWSALFRTDTGEIWGVGLDASGELGIGEAKRAQSTPAKFILPAGIKAKFVYNAGVGEGAAVNNTFVVATNGTVYGAGSNGYGQLGNSINSPFEAMPQKMDVFDGSSAKASDVITGLGTTIILSTDKIYYTVGNNNFGQLGNGSTTNTNTPAPAEYLRVIPAYIF